MDSGYLVCATPTVFKISLSCDHALKMCILFGYNPQINFCPFFSNLNFFGHFDNGSEWTVGSLCAQLLLQFNTDSLETLQML